MAHSQPLMVNPPAPRSSLPDPAAPAPAATAAAGPPAAEPHPVLRAEGFWVRYGRFEAVKNVSLSIPARQVTAIIGPSGCGKSTLLRSMNRMNDFIDGLNTSGRMFFHQQDIYGPGCDPVELRRRVGMVFQKPNPFPKSIFKNVAWGPRVNGYRGSLSALVEESLRKAALWDEVKDQLHKSALALSGGQQQRLCIARAIAMSPEVLLMDEPCSALDPIATTRIENLIDQLKAQFTVVLVTHNMQQAARVSDWTAFMLLGDLIEVGATSTIFMKPTDPRTQDYITGRFG